MTTVSDHMSTRLVSRNANTSVLEISKAMSEGNISSIAITDEQNKKIIGILTERDIVNNIAKGISLDDKTAGMLMSTPIFAIRNDLSVEEAARIMLKNKLRHLVVEDIQHGVVGMITTTDIAKYLKKKIEMEMGTNADQKHEKDRPRAICDDELIGEVWELFF